MVRKDTIEDFYFDDNHITEFDWKDVVNPPMEDDKNHQGIANIFSIVFVGAIVFYMWYGYCIKLTGFSSNKFYGFFASLGLIGFKCGLSIVEKHKKVESGLGQHWMKNYSVFAMISILIISFAFLDIAFETYILAHYFGVNNFVDLLLIVAIIILIDLIILSMVRLYLTREMAFSNSFHNKAITFKVLIPALTLISSAICLVLILIASIPLLKSETFNVFIPIGHFLPAGAYGGAEYFISVFEILLFNRYAATMLGLMTIAALTTIWTINQKQDSMYQKIGVFVMVGVPLLMIILMLVGAIPPPQKFIDVFQAPVLASFVYAFSMVCVFVLFLSLMMTFIHIAEDVLPGEDDD